MVPLIIRVFPAELTLPEQLTNQHSFCCRRELYSIQLDRPKTERSTRNAALSSPTRDRIRQWRQQRTIPDPDGWVFPSATGTTPLDRNNTWRGLIAPRLRTIQLDWATFQVMRRTHASLSRQAGIDPKLVADQLGDGLYDVSRT